MGKLIHSRLSDHPEFNALSYCWDAPEFTSTIHLEGSNVKVTGNCAWALQQLRSTEKDTIHWVDSICIDQSGQEEKVHQVQQMQEIYTQAEVCLPK